MLKVLAGILNLGNIEFSLDENEFAYVKENQPLNAAGVSYWLV